MCVPLPPHPLPFPVVTLQMFLPIYVKHLRASKLVNQKVRLAGGDDGGFSVSTVSTGTILLALVLLVAMPVLA